MRKFFLVGTACVFFSMAAVAQTDSSRAVVSTPLSTVKKVKDKVAHRASDHFMVQLADNMWTGTPDSIKSHIKGFQRSANVYFMLDKRFKTNPNLSVGFGLGVGTSNIYFKTLEAQLTAGAKVLPFENTAALNHYKRFKMSTAFLEVPVEFRYMADPENPNKGWKFALGAKVGTLLSAETRGKILQNSAGQTLNSAIVKVKDKAYFNGTRLGATGRVGYGNFFLFGAYYFTPVFKDGVAAPIMLVQAGIGISGL